MAVANKVLTLTPTNYGGHKAVKVTATFIETVNPETNKSTINFTVALDRNSWTTSFYDMHNKIRVKVTINGTTRIVPIPSYNHNDTWNGKITTPSSTTYNGGTTVTYSTGASTIYADSRESNGNTIPPIGGTNLAPVVVAHNDDGTKTITVAVAIEDDHSSSITYTTGAASTSGSWTLSNIARASTIAFTSGSTLTIKGSDYSSSENGLLFTIMKASPSYRHQLKAIFDGVGYTIANDVEASTATIGNSVNWKPSLLTQKDLLSGMQNVISKTGTIVLETYNGSNMIGSKSLTFSINIGTSSLVMPSITIPSGSSISLIEGDNTPVREQSWGDNIHVKTMSWPKIVDTNVVYTAGYAASISSYSLDYYDNNDVYISSINSISIADLNTVLSTNFNKNVQYKYKLKITDSRGKTASSDYLPFTLLDYSIPYINNGYSSYRCNSGGTSTDKGEYLKYIFSGGVSSINGNNTMTVRVGTKVSTDATYSYQNIITSGQTFSTNQISDNGNFSTGSKYDVIFEVTDIFGAKATKTMSIQSSFVLMDFKPDGHGVAFGKTNTQDGMEIDMPIYLGEHGEFKTPVKSSVDNLTEALFKQFNSTVTTKALFNLTRANRLVCLPADQIIIEKSTDKGGTWSDAGFTDAQKVALFLGDNSGAITIPLKNGARSTDCMLRITITAMKYNVPSGTAETSKYSYWNSTNVSSNERYCTLQTLYFWVNTLEDGLWLKVERSTGGASTTWETIFDTSTDADRLPLRGYSGMDVVSFESAHFGGSTTQTNNCWNYRLTLRLCTTDSTSDSTLFDDSKLNNTSTSQTTIIGIMGYGDNCWRASNNLMKSDHIYTWDADGNAQFQRHIQLLPGIGIQLKPITGSGYINLFCANGNNQDQTIRIPDKAGNIVLVKSLYNNTSGGTNAAFSLNEAYTNYDLIEVVYNYTNNSSWLSARFIPSKGSTLQLMGDYDDGTYLYHIVELLKFSGTSVTISSAIRWRFSTSGNATRATSATNIKIHTVWGYKTQ